MAPLYWIEESLAGILPTLWIFVGVGLPWALAALSTRHWHSRALIAATALALGPALMTAWMLLLGVAGAQIEARLLTAESILAGSVLIAVVGCLVAGRKRGRFEPSAEPALPLAFDEKLILGLIALAVLVRWIHTAYFPFTAYDALWVFGYQGRLFFLEGNIPSAIDYYPPFLSLQFAGAQILIGEINDHAARMVIPMLHIGSILAAHLLGERLVNRRAGLMTAALWSLHPHVGQWAPIGDLEIPLTFSFTLAAVFFLRAWRNDLAADERRHEAILGGFMLGIALFTKPTAGAFIWGVLLLLALDLARRRCRLREWKPRFRLAFCTGLACLPLGAVWYLRNLALGHEAITLPKAVWLTRALRNGDYLMPLAVAAVLLWIALAIRQQLSRRESAIGGFGLALLLAGVLASNPMLFPQRADPPASYLQAAEAGLMSAGLALCGFSLRRCFTSAANPEVRRMIGAGASALLLALPYLVTFFLSYSYHYRLGFAILPLLLLPSAIALSALLTRERIQGWCRLRRRGYYLALFCLSLPGIAAAAFDVTWSSLWLAREEMDSDIKKYQAFNPSLMEAVFGLEDYARETGKRPIALAPGEERLAFFFPQMRIVDQPLTRLADFEAAGATHFVYGAKAREAYLDAGLDPLRTQMVAALGRYDLFQKIKEHHDGTFSYELYQAGALKDRWTLPASFRTQSSASREVVYGGRLQAYLRSLYPAVIHWQTPITFEPAWRALRPLESDYQFVLQLRHPAEDGLAAQEWRLKPGAQRHGYYAPTLWEVDEVVRDRQILRLDREADFRRGESYVFALGVWDPAEERYLPLEIDGEPAGEFYHLDGDYKLLP